MPYHLTDPHVVSIISQKKETHIDPQKEQQQQQKQMCKIISAVESLVNIIIHHGINGVLSQKRCE